LGIFQ